MKADSSARTHKINGALKFAGCYNLEDSYPAVAPLLKRLDKWESVECPSIWEISEDEYEIKDEKDAWGTMRLDLNRLTALRKLRLGGRVWACVVGDKPMGRFDPSAGSVLWPQLPSLTSINALHLTIMSPSASLGLICSAPNLEELDITTDQHTLDWTPPNRKFIIAPNLRRLSFVLVGELSDNGDFEHAHHPFLRNLRCANLKDLTVTYRDEVCAPIGQIADFVCSNEFLLERLSLTFYGGGS